MKIEQKLNKRCTIYQATGLSGCHSKEQQPRQPDRGPVGQIKGHSHDIFTEQKRELQGSSLLKHKRAKGSLPKKKRHVEKKECLL
jgi:hypothetical protein